MFLIDQLLYLPILIGAFFLMALTTLIGLAVFFLSHRLLTNSHRKEARRAATSALTLEDKLAGQKQIKALELQRNQKRRTLFDAQDQVDKQREELIAQIEVNLQQQTELCELFTIRWSIR